MTRKIRLFLRDPTGATAVEYAMLAALIGVVIITGATTAGQAISGKFDYVATTVSAVPPSAA
jgi:pilus assembly protein Flp/PilA